MKGEKMITEEFDLKKYVNILCKPINGNSNDTWEISFKEAIEYKNKTLKNKKIYKFLPLQNTMNCNESNICEYYKKVNNRNIDNIKNNTIWLSKFDNLNDPFEMDKIYISETENKEYNYSYKFISSAFNMMKKSILLTCFTTDIEMNLPMWAHYANNHKGFCIEYKIIDSKKLFPVVYDDYRIKINNRFTDYISLSTKTDKNIHELLYLNSITNFIIQSFAYKNTIWEYEKEIRLFNCIDDILNLEKGKLFKLCDLGIEITGIYLGIDFIEFYKKTMVDICEKNDINLYMMYIDKDSNKPYLKYKKLN